MNILHYKDKFRLVENDEGVYEIQSLNKVSGEWELYKGLKNSDLYVMQSLYTRIYLMGEYKNEDWARKVEETRFYLFST